MYTTIGLDVRWILGSAPSRSDKGIPCLGQLIDEHYRETPCDIKDQLISEAIKFVDLCRQIVLRQNLGEGIVKYYLHEGGELNSTSRSTLCKTVEKVTGLSNPQANRLLNGLGLYSEETVLSTNVMATRRINAHDGTMQDLDIMYPVLLALGCSERLDRFLLTPYAFVANTASSLLRTRIKPQTNSTIIADLQAQQRREYPPIDDLKQDLARRRIMALYGIYLWATGAHNFVDSQPIKDMETCISVLAQAIKNVWDDAHWVFADEWPGVSRTVPLQIPRDYLEQRFKAIEDVATQVGMAVVGATPYDAEFPM